MDKSTPAAKALYARGMRAGLKAALLLNCIKEVAKAACSAAVTLASAMAGRLVPLVKVGTVPPGIDVMLTLTGGQLAEDGMARGCI